MNRALERLQVWDTRVSCLLAHQVRSSALVHVLQASSRAGNFGISAVTGLLLAALGTPRISFRFVCISLLALAVQKMLKAGAPRIRPCLLEGGPEQRAPIPDAGSFPSGHALHVVMCAVVVAHQIPPLAMAYVPLAILVAFSRVALGVHYPADVAAGGTIGAALATLVLRA